MTRKNNARTFLFLTPTNTPKELQPTPEILENIFKQYTRLREMQYAGMPTPFVDVLEISENLFEYLETQNTITSGIVDTVKRIHVFPTHNAQVFCTTKGEAEKYIADYEGTLKKVQEKLMSHVGQVVQEQIVISKFKETYLKPIQG